MPLPCQAVARAAASHLSPVAGLVARVVPAAELVDEAIKLGNQIGKFSKPIVAMCKEAVNAAYELSLQEGLRLERRLFHSTFATVSDGAGEGARSIVIMSHRVLAPPMLVA